MIVLRRSDSATACSASAFERKKRVRWKLVAPIAEKKTKRSTPARSAARSRRTVPSPFTSSSRRGGWSRIVAPRWIDGLDPAHRVPEPVRVAEVGEGDLDVDPLRPEPARIADERANRVPPLEELGDERRAHDARCPRDEDHPARHPTAHARARCT